MPFDPQIADIYQQATNFFAPAYSIARIILGIFIGGLVIRQIIGFFRSRSD